MLTSVALISRHSAADGDLRFIFGLILLFICFIVWMVQVIKQSLIGSSMGDEESVQPKSAVLGLSRVEVNHIVPISIGEGISDLEFEAAMNRIISEDLTDKRFYSKIVGASHRNSDGTYRRPAIAKCRPLEKLDLKHEPNNPFDSNAIAVLSPLGKQMGYLEARLASEVVSQQRRLGVSWEAYFRRATHHPETGKVVGCVLFLVRKLAVEPAGK